MELLHDYSSFINGGFEEMTSDSVVEDYNPSDSSLLARLHCADDQVLDKAVEASKTAFETWGISAREYRAAILNRMADAMDQNKDYLAAVEARDIGKPINEARDQMEMSASMYRYFAAAITAQDDVMVLHDQGSISALIRELLGVVGLILPWNAPCMLLSWKLAPALAAGNCVVVKPASAAPLIILELARLWADIIPAGVFNVLLATGGGTGEAMLHHPGFNKFSFTGSTKVGKHIGEVTGGNIVPCTLELGGKSANIIFPDAQIDRAIQYSMKRGEESIEDCIKHSGLLTRQKDALLELTSHPDFDQEMLASLADNLIEKEQAHYDTILKATNLISKLAPMAGLLGTLIPLGPGIIALGHGDTMTLSNSLLTAFDTTIAGLLAAGVCLVIHTFRNHWYAGYMSDLETLVDCVVDLEGKKCEAEA